MSKLTPGERVGIWVESVVKLWPIIIPLIGGTIYGNSESVKQMIHGAPPTIKEVQPPTEPEYYRQSIEDIIDKINKMEAGNKLKFENTDKKIRELQVLVN